jgi:1-acyl-sn-glycerol-3-phosphate acyltransferase
MNSSSSRGSPDGPPHPRPPGGTPRIGPALPRRGGRFSRSFAAQLLRAAGWRIEGEIPNAPRFVVIGAPHTSNWDSFLTFAASFALGVRLSWVGKHTLFRGPAGPLMRWLGGVSLDRRRSQGFVEAMVEEFRRRERFILAIMPQGTRGRSGQTQQWKTGFYHIAQGAGVPILLVAFDYGNRVLRFGPVIEASGELDLAAIRARFDGVRGRHPGV